MLGYGSVWVEALKQQRPVTAEVAGESSAPPTRGFAGQEQRGLETLLWIGDRLRFVPFGQPELSLTIWPSGDPTDACLIKQQPGFRHPNRNDWHDGRSNQAGRRRATCDLRSPLRRILGLGITVHKRDIELCALGEQKPEALLNRSASADQALRIDGTDLDVPAAFKTQALEMIAQWEIRRLIHGRSLWCMER